MASQGKGFWSGTFPAWPAVVIVFVFVWLGPLALISLAILAPLFPVLANTYRKEPTQAWRTALVASLAASLLLVMPNSPFFVGYDRPFGVPPIEKQSGAEAFVFPWVNAAIIAELPLLPLLVVSAVHSVRTRRRAADGLPDGRGAGDPG